MLGDSYLDIAIKLLLFVLFCIKMRWLFAEYILPFLRKQQQETHERWVALQEKHLVLVARKKQLATQFLQQEKQIALLTAKLESWHIVCHNKALERDREISRRAAAIKERALEQNYAEAQGKVLREAVYAVVNEARSESVAEASVLFNSYIKQGLHQLAGVEKKETTYESSYAKNAKSA